MQKSGSQAANARDSTAAGVFNITTEGYRSILKSGITLDQLYILECFSKGIDAVAEFTGEIDPYERVNTSILTLKRKGYLSEARTVTLTGKELLEASIQGSSINSFKLAIIQDGFDEWWKVYPPTDIFTHAGKQFKGSRSLRQKKDECRVKFMKIVNEGDHLAADLIRALEFEVLLKKEASVREGENKMKYMQNSLTYLNQRTFESFIEISKDSKINLKTKDNNDI